MVGKCKVSFIVPFCDTPVSQFFECIESIMKQTLKNYEIILVDDGSTNDELVLLSKKFSKEYSTVKYFRQDNMGAAVARNLALNKARGDWIVFVDADDRIERGFFDRNIELLGSSKDLIIFDYDLWNEKGITRKTMKKGFNLEMDRECALANIMFYPGKLEDFSLGSVWSKCFSRKFLKKNSICFLDELRKAQDRRFMAEVFAKVNNVGYQPRVMYRYRINDISITHKLNWDMEKYYKKLSKSFRSFCVDNGISEDTSKFLDYSIFLELLPLTVCHIDAGLSYRDRRRKYKKIYEEFNLKSAADRIYFRDVPSLKGKVKLLSIKLGWFLPIWKVFKKKQKKEKKEIFKGEKKC